MLSTFLNLKGSNMSDYVWKELDGKSYLFKMEPEQAHLRASVGTVDDRSIIMVHLVGECDTEKAKSLAIKIIDFMDSGSLIRMVGHSVQVVD